MVGGVEDNTEAGNADEGEDKGGRLEGLFGGNAGLGDGSCRLVLLRLSRGIVCAVGLHAHVFGPHSDKEDRNGQHDNGGDGGNGQITLAPCVAADDGADKGVGENAGDGTHGEACAIDGAVVLFEPVVDHQRHGDAAVKGDGRAHNGRGEIDLPQGLHLRKGAEAEDGRDRGAGEHLADAVFMHELARGGEGQG